MPRVFRRRPPSNLVLNTQGHWRAGFRKTVLWLGGLVAGALAAYLGALASGVLQPVMGPLTKTVASWSCRASKSIEQPDNQRLLIVIPTLDGDTWGGQTETLLSTFLGSGIEAERLCETIAIDLTKSVARAEQDIKLNGQALATRHKANLVVLGRVVKPGDSIQLWLVNETGGCDARPTNLVLDHGLMPAEGGLGSKLSERLLAASLAEMSAACNHTDQTDWSRLGATVLKVQAYLVAKGRELPSALADQVGDRVSDSLGLLCTYDNLERWYPLARTFNLGRADGPHVSSRKLRAADLYAESFVEETRWNRSGDQHSLAAALDMMDQAVQLSSDTDYLNRRLDLAEASDDAPRILAATSAMVTAQPNDALSYWHRAMLQFGLGHYVEAVYDYELSDKMDAQSFRPVWEALSYLRMHDRRNAQREIDDGLKLFAKPTEGGSEIVLAYLNGSLARDSFISAMVGIDNKNQAGHRCAAQVFIGEIELAQGQPQRARALLSTALGLCSVPAYLRVVKAELARLPQ